MNPEPRASGPPDDSQPEASSDRWLVRRCLRGDEEAWEKLVAKYKNLVYSIALRKGVSPDDASDLFQAVWVQVYSKLSTLRKEGSVRSWLISVTLNECYHWLQKRIKRDFRETSTEVTEVDERFAVDPADAVEEEQTLLVQKTIAQLAPRCQELIRLLFYEYPKVPYKEIASRLGLAVGSIGFIRGRCLKKLHKLLQDQGVG